MLMGTSSADNVNGAWTAVHDWPLITVHAVMTPDGRVLTYGTKEDGTQTGYFIYDVWDPSAGLNGGHMTLNNMTMTDIFCSSQVILPESGNIFIAGGDNWTGSGTTNSGNNNTNIFDPGANSLTRAANMNRARWYSSSTVLVDGEVYIQGGTSGGDLPEVRETSGAFRLLTGVPTGGYAAVFPRNFLAPDGRVFGYDTSGKMYFVSPAGSGSIAQVGQFSSSNVGWNSSTAMFEPGKILQFGGNSNGAVVIDINGPQPVVTATQSMSSQRRWVNATVLANGKVLATGGSRIDNALTDVNNSAEIWDPDTGQWHVGSSGALARLYHSSGLLLPDGSVLVSGGGAPGPLNNTNAEIYYPPYLFSAGGGFATRPEILSAPDSVNVGDQLSIQVDTAGISRVTLVKTGSVTHSFNMDQRFLELPFVASGTSLTADLPVRASDTPPGFYQMFVIDDAGVPSMASMLRINIDPTPNTAVDYTPTIGGGGGSAFQLACAADEVLVGVHGRYATYVNQIGAQCVQMDQLGRWIGSPNNGPVTGSTTTGTAFSKTCPQDFAMSGFRGRSGDYVNQIEIECRALTPAGGVSGAGQFLGATGGTGGSFQALQRCGTENPVYALYGRSGGWLDNFGVQCRVAPITPISINSTPVVANPGPQTGAVGLPVSLQIDASDGDNDPLIYSASGLPTGLSIDNQTGLITGTPTAMGVYTVTVSASDAEESDSAVFDWTIDPAPPLVVDPVPPQAAQPVNAAIVYTASFSGGQNPVFSWDFGDGTPATTPSASPSTSHAFSMPGIYFITLTATDDLGAPQIQTFVQTVHLPPTAAAPSSSSQLAYEVPTAGNPRLWTVNPDNDSVSIFDAVTNAKLTEIPVGTAPRSLAIAPDGRVWVSNKTTATISIIDANSLTVMQTLNLAPASQPHGIVFSPAANEAYVSLAATGQLAKLDGSTGAQLAVTDVGPNPRQLAINAAGTKVYVSRFITPRQPGEETATVLGEIGGQKFGGEIVVVATDTLAVNDTIILQHSDKPDAENQGGGVPNYLGAATISPDGLTAWVPSKQDNIGRGMLRSGANINFQNTVRAISSRIDINADSEDYAGRIDHDNASIASAAAFDPTGIYLFVALETSREVAVVDAYGGFEIFRIDTGIAPQALVVSADGSRLFVTNFMDRNISVFDLTDLRDTGQWNISSLAQLPRVANENLSAEVLQGKKLFYDARDTRLARDRYMSCASCHNDGGQDGRVWDLTGMGEGLRNTINLSGSGAAHGPLHWSANFDEVQDFEGQIRDLAEGTGLMSDTLFNAGTTREPLGDPKAGLSSDLDALAAYVASLNSFADSPNRAPDGSLTAEAGDGLEVFRSENCAQCHSGSEFTDSSTSTGLHDIGTLKPSSGDRLGGALTGIDTPSLRGAWESAPYLHDGSAASLSEAIEAHNGISLNASELSQLVSYIEEIDAREATAPTPNVAVELIIDNLDANTAAVGTWNNSSGANPYAGNSIYSNGGGTFTWQPTIPASGIYNVYAWWTYHNSRSTNVPYRISHDGGTATVTVDQHDAALAGQWVLLGSYNLTAGANGNVSVSSENGQASADAVRYELLDSGPPDTTPPSTPTSLSANATSDSEITLAWNPSTDDSPVITYWVYQDGDYANPVGSAVNATSQTVTGLSPSTSYSFEVRAIDAAGNESGLSNSADATTLAPAVETIVDNLDANTSRVGTWPNSSGPNPYDGNSVYSNSGGTFTWQPNLASSGSYQVYAWWTYHSSRSTTVPYRISHDGGTTAVIANQKDQALGGQWVLLGVYNFTAGVNGEVSVSSENGQASADAVRWVLLDTGPPDSTPPTDPTNLVATAVTDQQIDLTWTASTDASPIISYRIYQDGNHASPIGTVVNSSSYSVENLSPNTSYTFEVQAVDGSGNESSLSNVANATTLAASPETIVDNQDANTSTVGTWRNSGGANPYAGNSVYSNSGGLFTWQPGVSVSGNYNVYAWWTYHNNRSTNVPYRITHDGGEATVIVNQNDANLAGQWVLLGNYNLTAGVNGDISVSSENGQASADAVRLLRTN